MGVATFVFSANHKPFPLLIPDIRTIQQARHPRPSSMANYKPTYPANVPVDAGIKEFITSFYGVSDTPGKNTEWLDFFRDDATLMMEKKEATGRAGMCCA